MSKLYKLISGIVSSLFGTAAGVLCGYFVNILAEDVTKGLWSVEKGAPILSVYVVMIIPAVFGHVYGFEYGWTHGMFGVLYGMLMGILVTIVAASLTYAVCLFAGIFYTKTVVNIMLGILAGVTILVGPGVKVLTAILRRK